VFSNAVETIIVYKARVHLKPGAKPVFKKSRQVTYALLPRVEEELKRLPEEGIL